MWWGEAGGGARWRRRDVVDGAGGARRGILEQLGGVGLEGFVLCIQLADDGQWEGQAKDLYGQVEPTLLGSFEEAGLLAPAEVQEVVQGLLQCITVDR